MNPNWTEVRAEWEVINKGSTDKCFEKYGCEYGGKSSWQWVGSGWGESRVSFSIFFSFFNWRHLSMFYSWPEDLVKKDSVMYDHLSHGYILLTHLPHLISLHYTKSKTVFYFCLPNTSMVSGTDAQDMLLVVGGCEHHWDRPNALGETSNARN